MYICVLMTDSALCLQITPLLNELRQGNLVGNLEALTKSASEAATDIHNLQTEVHLACNALVSPAYSNFLFYRHSM